MASQQDILLCEYSARLDASLILAISSEHENLDAARKTLDTLAESCPTFATDTLLDALPESEDDQVEFIKQFFPDKLPHQIRRALSAAQGNTQNVIDLFLNEEYLKTIEPLQKSVNGSKNKRTKKNGTIYLNSPRMQSPASSTTSLVNSASENVWVNLESTTCYLGDLLSINSQIITSAYHQADSNWQLALDRILDKLESTRLHLLENSAISISLVELSEMFPQHPVPHITRILLGTNGNADGAIDLLWKLEDLALLVGSSSLDKFTNTTKRPNALYIPGTTYKPSIPVSHAALTALNSRNASASSSRGSASATTTTTDTTDHGSSEECRNLAQDYRDRRNDAFRKAAESYQKGKSAGRRGGEVRGVAAYWAEIGREANAKAKVWDERAVRAQIRERGKLDENTVDLHNMTLNEALVAVTEALNVWWSVNRSRTVSPLRIITGLGNHSTNQNPIIRPAIQKLLDREGWSWYSGHAENKQRGSGVLYVTGLTKKLNTS